MNCDGPILTDSGGFQVFSLSDTRVVGDDGVESTSVTMGSRHLFTPQCLSYRGAGGSRQTSRRAPRARRNADRAEIERAVARTSRWAAECRRGSDPRRPAPRRHRPGRHRPGQGGVRRSTAESPLAATFGAYAIGGLSVGDVADETAAHRVRHLDEPLPAERPLLHGDRRSRGASSRRSRAASMCPTVRSPMRLARTVGLHLARSCQYPANARYAADLVCLIDDIATAPAAVADLMRGAPAPW